MLTETGPEQTQKGTADVDSDICRFFVPVRGKAAKRRRWREERAGFEEAPRFADAKRMETGEARRWSGLHLDVSSFDTSNVTLPSP